MYVGRILTKLNDIPMEQWDIKELAYYHKAMGEMSDFLNSQGVSIHQKIINEIKSRGGLPHDAGAWDHSSEIIYD